VACLLAGLTLIHEPRVRWLLLAGAVLLVTQYPRSDTIHLAWSAPLLLVVGAAVLSRINLLLAVPAVVAAFALCLPTLSARGKTIREATATVVGIPAANGLRVPAQTWSDLLNTTAEIRHRTTAGEPIFVYPSSPLLYVLAQRPNPTRFDHLNPGAASQQEVANVMGRLEQQNVRVAVVSDYWRAEWGAPLDNAALEAWLDARFGEVARFGPYRVLLRLDARL
jgi:hypothetical protein